MTHQALYRVYRPRVFSEVVGQGRTVETLREAVRQNRLSHAYLFSGPRGTGKTSVARILAKAVNCETLRENGDPCLTCASCLEIEKGQHLDIIEIDAASNRGIDEIREIKERITHRPAMGQVKVYIVDEVHMLSSDAFNALLKTLEEPPDHVIFILATTELQKIPATVLSRCQRYEFQRLHILVIQNRLRLVAEQEGIEADPEALELIAEYADGALRDGLTLLDQTIAASDRISVSAVSDIVGLMNRELMERLFTALRAETIQPLIIVLADASQSGRDFRLLLKDIARHIRDVLVYRQAGPEFFPPYRREWLKTLEESIPPTRTEAWFDALDVLAEAEGRLRGGFPTQLVVELALFKVKSLLIPREESHDRTPSGPLPEVSPAEVIAQVPEQTLSPPHDESREGNFLAVLERIKRERPSTYALIQPARHREVAPGHLIIGFQYPAHRDLMLSQPHKEIFEEALRGVYGSHVQYELKAGTEFTEEDGDSAQTAARLTSEQVREWFGSNVRLVGFDD